MTKGTHGVGAKILVGALAAFAQFSTARAATLEVFSVAPAFSPFNATGKTVTIKGVGFRASTTVKFDGVLSPTITFVDSRTLTAVVPVVAAAKVSTISVADTVNGTDEFYPFQYTGAAVYFVSLTGLDTNNGTTPTTPFRTIAKGLASATSTIPTEIRVSAGTYGEHDLTIQNDSALTCGWAPGFASRDPEANVTVLDGLRGGFIMRTGGLAAISAIDGCTFTRGLRDGFGGGALVVTADSAVVNNNVFVGNLSTTMGGAIYSTASTSYGARPTFSNNVIIGNRAHNKQGGGIIFYPNYNPQPPVRVNVTNNQIVGNRSFGSRGGGLALATGSYVNYNAGRLVVADNFIAFNRAKTGGGADFTLQGYGDFFQLSLNNNLVCNNTVPGVGGGVSFGGTGAFDGYATSNTISGNVGGSGQGGGIVTPSSLNFVSTFAMNNLILWGNPGGDAVGVVIDRATYSNSGTPLTGAGNISVNPAFVNGPLGTFYLRQNDPNAAPDSPSVNAGSGTAASIAVDSLTTRPDLVLDSGLADQGYHFPPTGALSGAPIALSRIDPASGDFMGNDWVLIRGNGFNPGAIASFDGIAATKTLYVSATRVLAQPAAHAQGLVNVRVTNPNAAFAEMAGGYRYLDNEPPTWVTTVGLQSATTPADCQRTVVLDWNDAVDTTSNPIVYEVYREDCVPSGNTTVPCANFGYIPNGANFRGTTTETTYVDPNIPAGGQDPRYVYAVRARDSASTGTNKEWNFAKRVSFASSNLTDTTPPSPVGKTLNFISPTILDWAGAVGAVSYGVYRTGTASLYNNPPGLTKLATLTKLNNDFNGDGVTDSQYTDTAVPALGQAFFYKISALDICNVETTSELLP